jgi:hypothetical protein
MSDLNIFYAKILKNLKGSDPVPDPLPRVPDLAKSFGSLRIQIPNTVWKD